MDECGVPQDFIIGEMQFPVNRPTVWRLTTGVAHLRQAEGGVTAPELRATIPLTKNARRSYPSPQKGPGDWKENNENV